MSTGIYACECDEVSDVAFGGPANCFQVNEACASHQNIMAIAKVLEPEFPIGA